MKNYSNNIIDPENMKVERRKVLFVVSLMILASTAIQVSMIWFTAKMIINAIIKTQS